MNARRAFQIAGLAIVVGCVVVYALKARHHNQAAQAEARQKTSLKQPARQMPAVATPAVPDSSTSESNVSARQVDPPKINHEVAVQKVAVVKKSAPVRHEPIRDPLAREALSLVGADLDAEEYWVAAINDPSLSADERQNLIEDLNEDGLSDPKHPGPEDLPLILSRIQLIEELEPFAMDQVNADAFAEAYKDLVNMLNGRPVQ